jgi:hypothetical protein
MIKSSKELFKDISKLEGLKLSSIRVGAEITIIQIDWENQRIILETAIGKRRSRPFLEMERLWSSLCSKPCIHVDSELGGSGTSRNQPETILANLPYVEWFKISNKKHLSLVDAPSHHFGTLKQMDAVKAEALKSKNELTLLNASGSAELTQTIAISGDIGAHSKMIEKATGIKPNALEMGTYSFQLPSCQLILVSVNAVGGKLPQGIYLVLKGNPISLTNDKVEICGVEYKFCDTDGLCLLFKN